MAPLVVILIVVALAFDFLNGLHDAANSIATIVSTRVLPPLMAVFWAALFNFIAFLFFGLHVANTVGKGIVDPAIVSTRVLPPRYAVFWAAFFNFIAFLFFGLHVAQTVGKGIIHPDIVSDAVIFGALGGAITWNVATWLAGIPSSSSHALIGGLLGAGVAKAGFNPIVWSGVLKTVAGIVLAPGLGCVAALMLMLLVAWTFLRFTPFGVDRFFRRAQLVSASLYALGHGGNDAQKTMGIIAVLLYSQGYMGTEFYVPFWVVLTCQAAMGLGTLFGGWRIVKTMGSKITRLTPMQGFCAETGGAITLFGATYLGVPVSTTHTITGAIIGVGSARRVSAVRWNIATSIVMAWIITMPATALIAAIFYWLSGLAS